MPSRSILLAFLFLVACTVPGPSEPVAQITAQQNQWRAKNITTYRISVMKVQAIFHAQTNTITVENGKVTQQSAICTPAPFEGRECTVQEFDANEFTVDGLFNTALRYAPASEKNQLRVTFDENYFFPTTISRDEKQVVDDELFWRVVAFEPLR